ncbi:TetR family transcriptional regulator C-terminal domain-containing protein [Palleronia sp. LCG004]|uniref:TetR family transcriptional regulator C-terminal domain-containing protein n=1 Tax=Palleronia sp. LCG004 TaxID=3079304 RepID=UPI00294393CE|nr:TetR family transcriptional regulator C-terminal domain-containing protein [Palleronia sp. LCG004]WOI55742.1 TetR family transcriptional regulator C-terminal domain-containing protein [Palleronia sp. LCG004]
MAETRIQSRNRAAILDAGLEVFSRRGFGGATLDQIAAEAGLSKPNLLYYFPSKEAIHRDLLLGLMGAWLDPMRRIDPEGEPLDEIMGYVRRKMDLTRHYPRESRLFANEILQGAHHIDDTLGGELRDLVDRTAALIQGWVDRGRLAPVDPHHTIISVWALTQHYADFDVQVRAVLGDADPLLRAEAHVEQLFRRLLTPPADSTR